MSRMETEPERKCMQSWFDLFDCVGDVTTQKKVYCTLSTQELSWCRNEAGGKPLGVIGLKDIAAVERVLNESNDPIVRIILKNGSLVIFIAKDATTQKLWAHTMSSLVSCIPWPNPPSEFQREALFARCKNHLTKVEIRQRMLEGQQFDVSPTLTLKDTLHYRLLRVCGTSIDQVPFPDNVGTINGIFARGDRCAALTADGSIYLWGRKTNTPSYVGRGRQFQLSPQPDRFVLEGDLKVLRTELGSSVTSIVTTCGRLLVSGSLGHAVFSYPEQIVDLEDLQVVQAVQHQDTLLVLAREKDSDDMDVYTCSPKPQRGKKRVFWTITKIDVLSDKNVSSISASHTHCACVTFDGSIFMWGLNQYTNPKTGERVQDLLGVGSLSRFCNGPSKCTLLEDRRISRAWCGSSFTVALPLDGRSILLWGQVGNSGEIANAPSTIITNRSGDVDLNGKSGNNSRLIEVFVQSRGVAICEENQFNSFALAICASGVVHLLGQAPVAPPSTLSRTSAINTTMGPGGPIESHETNLATNSLISAGHLIQTFCGNVHYSEDGTVRERVLDVAVGAMDLHAIVCKDHALLCIGKERYLFSSSLHHTIADVKRFATQKLGGLRPFQSHASESDDVLIVDIFGNLRKDFESTANAMNLGFTMALPLLFAVPVSDIVQREEGADLVYDKKKERMEWLTHKELVAMVYSRGSRFLCGPMANSQMAAGESPSRNYNYATLFLTFFDTKVCGMTPQSLLEGLIRGFNEEISVNNMEHWLVETRDWLTEEEEERLRDVTRTGRQLRILSFLHDWIKAEPLHFVDGSGGMLGDLLDFLLKADKGKTLPVVSEKALSLYNALLWDPDILVPTAKHASPSFLEEALATEAPEDIDILQYPPQVIAEQLTFVDNMVFTAHITARRVLAQTCKATTMRYGEIYRWAQKEVISRSSSSGKSRAAEHFVLVMAHLWSLNNFLSFEAISNAIDSEEVRAVVGNVWNDKDLLKKSANKAIKDIRAKANDVFGSPQAFREFYEPLPPPKIPAIAPYYHKLIYISERFNLASRPLSEEDRVRLLEGKNSTKSDYSFDSTDETELQPLRHFLQGQCLGEVSLWLYDSITRVPYADIEPDRVLASYLLRAEGLHHDPEEHRRIARQSVGLKAGKGKGQQAGMQAYFANQNSVVASFYSIGRGDAKEIAMSVTLLSARTEVIVKNVAHRRRLWNTQLAGLVNDSCDASLLSASTSGSGEKRRGLFRKMGASRVRDSPFISRMLESQTLDASMQSLYPDFLPTDIMLFLPVLRKVVGGTIQMESLSKGLLALGDCKDELPVTTGSFLRHWVGWVKEARPIMQLLREDSPNPDAVQQVLQNVEKVLQKLVKKAKTKQENLMSPSTPGREAVSDNKLWQRLDELRTIHSLVEQCPLRNLSNLDEEVILKEVHQFLDTLRKSFLEAKERSAKRRIEAAKGVITLVTEYIHTLQGSLGDFNAIEIKSEDDDSLSQSSVIESLAREYSVEELLEVAESSVRAGLSPVDAPMRVEGDAGREKEFSGKAVRSAPLVSETAHPFAVYLKNNFIPLLNACRDVKLLWEKAMSDMKAILQDARNACMSAQLKAVRSSSDLLVASGEAAERRTHSGAGGGGALDEQPAMKVLMCVVGGDPKIRREFLMACGKVGKDKAPKLGGEVAGADSSKPAIPAGKLEMGKAGAIFSGCKVLPGGESIAYCIMEGKSDRLVLDSMDEEKKSYARIFICIVPHDPTLSIDDVSKKVDSSVPQKGKSGPIIIAVCSDTWPMSGTSPGPELASRHASSGVFGYVDMCAAEQKGFGTLGAIGLRILCDPSMRGQREEAADKKLAKPEEAEGQEGGIRSRVHTAFSIRHEIKDKIGDLTSKNSNSSVSRRSSRMPGPQPGSERRTSQPTLEASTITSSSTTSSRLSRMERGKGESGTGKVGKKEGKKDDCVIS